jgi:prolyl oligopeptidase
MKTFMYPTTKKVAVTDTYFGITVPDPYRWLEDDRATDTEAWVRAENEVTYAYLDQIPFRETIRNRLEVLWNYEKFGTPQKQGEWTYFSRNSGLQNQSVIYRQKDGRQPEVFLDPNQFSKDGTTSLQGLEFTKDGSLAAYQISEGGSDWRKIIVLNATNRSPIGDILHNIKFSGIAWKGNQGFYYSSYEKPAEGSELSGLTQYHKLYYHQLGTPQSSDQLIFGGGQTPRRYIGAYLTEDERYLVITAANSTTGNELYIQDLSIPGTGIVTVVGNFDHEHSIIDNLGSKLYIDTNLNAPNRRVVTFDASAPDVINWKELIPETQNVLTVSTGGGKLFAGYLQDATTLVLQYNRNGKLEHEIELPGVGTADGFSTKKEDNELYYIFTSYIYPSTIFKYNIVTGQSTLYKKPDVQFDPALYESKQVFYPSKDGTLIPMMITYKRGIMLNGKNPTLLYAYGGFGVSLTPAFNTSNIVLLENGGIYAVPNIRGGGEYGETWHQAGIKLNKQNVFDDFMAAAEYLIEQKYTSPNFLAISGGSNGGLLVGAVITQRPDLCKVALPAVGVLDMLRYHQFTAGAGWAYDYGTAEDSEEMFNYLYRYSPYHTLKPGSYPATMITTADHDDRVVPAHSFKFAARLQEMQQGLAPALIRIETNAGHGAGQSTAQIINQQADKWAFMYWNMGIDWLKI